MVQDKTWTDRTLAERGPSEIQILKNQQLQAKMKARVDHGMAKYPDADHDYDGYQRTYDPEMSETIKCRDYPIPLKYVKQPAVGTQKQLLLNRKNNQMAELAE